MQRKRKIDTDQNQKIIRLRNEKRVLDYFIKHHYATIKDVSLEFGLSATAVQTIFESLKAKDLVIENGLKQTDRGRRPVEYALNKNFKYIVSIDLGQQGVHIAVSNLFVEFVCIEKLKFEIDKREGDIANYLILHIEEIMKNNNLTSNNILSIVIGQIGVIDESTGVISYAAGSTIWESQPLRLILRDYFECEVIVKNDINLSTIGEQRQGVAINKKNFIYFRFDVGAKTGIVINNVLYEGANGAAGEIGFSLLPVNHGKYRLDRLENWTTLDFLQKKIKKSRNQIKKPELRKLLSESFDDFYKELSAYYLTDKVVHQILTDFLIQLGNLITNVVSVVDIPFIVLGGKIVDLGDKFLNDLQKYVNEKCFFVPEIKYSKLGEKSGLIGATFVGLETLQKFIY